MLNAGDLNNLFTIENRNDTQDTDTGAINPAFAGTDKVWGSLKPIVATNNASDNHDVNLATHKIECRYTPLINKDSRLKLRSRYFHIVTFLADDRNKEMSLTVAEVQ